MGRVTMSDEKIRWGIMGTGSAARYFARGLCFTPGAELTAVGSRTLRRAEAFARQVDVAKACGSYEALVEDDIDVVYIATPHALHKTHCLLALQAGKAVLCEKPFAMNASEAEEIARVARQKKLFCMEAMWMHFLPGMHKAIELIQAGAVGSPRMLLADFGVPTAFDPASRVFDAALGGGALLDRGIYPLALAWRLFGRPEEVRATMTRTNDGVDEHCSVSLKYRDGQMATLAATLSGYAGNQAAVIGTEGRVMIGEPFCRPDRLVVSRAPAPVPAGADIPAFGFKEKMRESRFARNLRRLLPNRRDRLIYVPYVGNGYNYEALEVMHCMNQGITESSVWSLDDTIGVLRTIDAVRASASH